MKKCPRCGKHKLNPIEEMNALSRFKDEYICDDCGKQEALNSYFGKEEGAWWIDENPDNRSN